MAYAIVSLFFISSDTSDKIYAFDVSDEWCFASENGGTVVYAYGSAEMTALSPRESTSALISLMTMSEISNAEYAAIDDINITITGYAIGTEGIDVNPSEAWNQCKLIGDIQEISYKLSTWLSDDSLMVIREMIERTLIADDAQGKLKTEGMYTVKITKHGDEE